MIEDRYLARNPLHPVVSPLHDVAEAGDTLPIYRISRPEPWRVINAHAAGRRSHGRLAPQRDRSQWATSPPRAA